MPDGNRISLSKLEKDLHTGLKLWHNAKTNVTPLDYLYLFQQARRDGASHPRQATNRLILQALEHLEAEQAIEAKLLRLRFLDDLKMHIVANRLNLAEPTAYKMQRQALRSLAAILRSLEHQARRHYQTTLERKFNLPPDVDLIGVEERLEQVLEVILKPEPPWLVSIEGLGGIGKTALANGLVRRPELTRIYEEIAWISAKQQDFLPGFGLEPLDRPALSVDTLIDELLAQLDETGPLTRPHREKVAALTKLLKQEPRLVVVDNLETLADYQSLLPLLRRLAQPTRFLLTSRHSLRAYGDVFCLNLPELSQGDTIRFIRHEARVRGLSMVAGAAADQLEKIYGVVGGNPLALKLVLGQISVLPLSQVVENLRQTRGKNIDELYIHIYWRAWHMLDGAGQQLLLIMPLAQDSSLAELAALSELGPDSLDQALQQLTALSLVEVGGDLEERRYSIHRLTETFILKEALKWQSST